MLNENWQKIKYFKPYEFECNCGCGLDSISYDLVSKLDLARELAGIYFKINRGISCAKHNKLVGGSATSSHLLGLAVDIKVVDSSARFKILSSLIRAGFTRLGVYKDWVW